MNIQEFQQLEKKYRKTLSTQFPVVVRFDGKNITKNHQKYHLMEKNGFTRKIMDAAQKIARGADCELYAALDEVSIIFTDAFQFFRITEDPDLLYSAIMILQDFLKEIRSAYPEVKFNVSVFNIDANDIEDYICCRQDLCQSTSVVYYAKEVLSAKDYVNKTREEIICTLKQNGYHVAPPDMQWFFHGIRKKCRCQYSHEIMDLYLMR